MLEQILTSGILILGIFFLRFIFGNRMQQCVKYALWLLVLIKLLLPFISFENPYNIMRVVGSLKDTMWTAEGTTERIRPASTGLYIQEREPAGEVEKGQDAEYSKASQKAGFHNYSATVTDNINSIMSVIWIGGAVIAGFCLLAANLRFFLRLKSNRKEMLLSEGYPIKIYETETVSGPCLFGFLRPVVYLPVGFKDSDISMEHIIAHEYMHYRHRDYLWAVLRGICLAVYWFHPLVWMAAFASIQDGELACDEAVIRYLGEGKRRDYGRTLIGMAAYCGEERVLLSCATHAKGKKNEMKGRIAMIVKKPKTKFTTGAVLLLALVLLSGTAFSRAGDKENIQVGDVKEVVMDATQEKYAKQVGDAKEIVMDATKEKEDVWEYQLNEIEDCYLIDVTGCQVKNGRYALRGTTYANTVVIFTTEEKKRIEQGEKVVLVCDCGDKYTLSKSDDADQEGGYQLTGENGSVNMKLIKGQDGNKSGWILCDSLSGMQWRPPLPVSLTFEPYLLIEVNNYYAYYDLFSNYFTVDIQDGHKENAMGSRWTMKQYYEQYLRNVAKMKKQGAWSGSTLARISITHKNGSTIIKDCYMP